jgi:hypothetical protein
MTTYKGIQGFTIQNLSADPSNPIEGQVWYNSTSNVWKVEEATTVGMVVLFQLIPRCNRSI